VRLEVGDGEMGRWEMGDEILVAGGGGWGWGWGFLW